MGPAGGGHPSARRHGRAPPDGQSVCFVECAWEQGQMTSHAIMSNGESLAQPSLLMARALYRAATVVRSHADVPRRLGLCLSGRLFPLCKTRSEISGVLSLHASLTQSRREHIPRQQSWRPGIFKHAFLRPRSRRLYGANFGHRERGEVSVSVVPLGGQNRAGLGARRTKGFKWQTMEEGERERERMSEVE
jgi:hypothetical protein